MKELLKRDPLIWSILKFFCYNITYIIVITPPLITSIISYNITKDPILTIIITLISVILSLILFAISDAYEVDSNLKKWIQK